MDRVVTALCRSATLVVVLCLNGCGSGNGLVPVEGVVTLDAKPLPEATVILHSVTAAGPGPFTGTTDAEGKFTLSPSANPSSKGASPGEYRLSISTAKYAPVEGGDDMTKPKLLAPELVPGGYQTGNMRFEVPAEGTTEANFDIRSGR